METIVTHIEYLLRHHACVIVPGIGAFIATMHPARFSEDGLTLLPPHREICFNPAVSHDDGALANSIARRQGIAFEEARTQMLRLIAGMLRCLEADGEITLGKIGTLTRKDENIIEFHPRRKDTDIATQLGSPAISISSLKKYEEDSLYNIEEETGVAEKSNTQNSADESFAPKHNADYWYIAINKRIAKAAACIAIVASICISLCVPLSAPVSDRQIEPAQANVLPVKEIVEKEAVYHLIVASFKTEEEAREYIASNDNCGYPLEIERTNAMWMVSAASSAEKAELISLSRSSDFRSQFAGSWVWKSR